jgi:hypothetical protein
LFRLIWDLMFAISADQRTSAATDDPRRPAPPYHGES